MVIVTTPHTEPAQASQNAQNEIPQKFKPEKNGIGVFAKILAGLTNRGLQKTGTGEDALGVEIPTDIPLAENAKINDLKTISIGKAGTRAGKTTKEAAIAADNEPLIIKKPLKSDKIEPEQLPVELSQQERNILLTVNRLTDRSTEQIPMEEHGEFALEGDSVHIEWEAPIQTEAVFVRSTTAAGTVEQENQAITTTSAAFVTLESGEKLQNTSEKTKNRVNSAEIPVAEKQSAREMAQITTSQQVEAKKTAVVENGRGRLEETRNRDRRRGQGLTLEVRDFRSTGTQSETAGRDSAVHLRATAETRLPADGASREITLELHLPDQGNDTSAVTTWEAKAGQAFEDMMARELHQNFNNDIVRHASVMLRDSGEGTIRLALKPESLGNVKIRLEMAENKITGQIVVESEEALRAFEREISSLEKAFRDSGFDGANLEMSLAADSREAQQQWQGTEASQSLPWQFAASRYDAAVERMELPLTLDVYWQGARAINMLA